LTVDSPGLLISGSTLVVDLDANSLKVTLLRYPARIQRSVSGYVFAFGVSRYREVPTLAARVALTPSSPPQSWLLPIQDP
jgi:hypothetical protein